MKKLTQVQLAVQHACQPVNPAGLLQIAPARHRIDNALIRAAAACGSEGMLDDPLLLERLRLRCSMRGGHVRSLAFISPSPVLELVLCSLHTPEFWGSV